MNISNRIKSLPDIDSCISGSAFILGLFFIFAVEIISQVKNDYIFISDLTELLPVDNPIVVSFVLYCMRFIDTQNKINLFFQRVLFVNLLYFIK